MKIVSIDNLNEIRITTEGTEEGFQASYELGKKYWDEGLIHKWNIFILDEDENVLAHRLPHMFDFNIPEDWIFTLDESIKLYKYEFSESDILLYNKLIEKGFKFDYNLNSGVLT